MSARLEVRNALHVSGRGAVLIGFVREGTVAVGQRTEALLIGQAERSLEVASIQRLASAGAGESAVGLVFRQPPSFPELEAALPRGTMLRLE